MLSDVDDGFADRSAEYKRLVDRGQMVLNRRASGASVAVIADSLDITAEDVQRVLRRARERGDVRALSDCEAIAKREATAALTPVAERPAVAPSRVAERLARECDRLAARWDVSGNPDAADGMRHLADLYRHCDRRYPELDIPPGDDCRAMRAVGAGELFSYYGSPAAACAFG